MAILKQRLHRKNASGSYDTVHLETSADLVLMTDGTKLSNKISSMDTAIAGKAASSHTHSSITGVLPVDNGGTGVTSIAALKDALGITTASAPSTTISVGGVVSMASLDWICVHSDSNYYYLMTKYIIGSTVFGREKIYAGSQAALMAFLFGAVIGVWGNPAFGNITVNEVPGYCFIPSMGQFSGGFSYFNYNSYRIATDSAGNHTSYWTSSTVTTQTTNHVYYMNNTGNLDMNYPTVAHGFWPCVALKK